MTSSNAARLFGIAVACIVAAGLAASAAADHDERMNRHHRQAREGGRLGPFAPPPGGNRPDAQGKPGGRLSPSERADLHRDLRDANRDIYQHKYGGPPR